MIPEPNYFLPNESSFSLTASLTKSASEVYSGCEERYSSILSSNGSGRETVRYPLGISYANPDAYLTELHYTSRMYSGKGYILRYIYFNYDGKWRNEKNAGI